MAVVGMMQVTVDQIVMMITVRDGFMTAAGSVDMTCIMPRAGMTVTAFRWVGIAFRNCVLFDDSFFGLMMKMPFVQVVNMALMFHRRVTTLLSMCVVMIGMNVC